MFQIECLTKDNSSEESVSCWILCNPNETCGPDYGTDCMPDCDPADD